MAANRKLQTEIQQTLKKVEEGVELFDEIWEKVYAAEQQSLKEKYENDLKKEIKKLQRLRDQIKTWIGSSEIKDKNPLIEMRKLIENKMELFKVCEKDTKTKAYSKEGLARGAQIDPKDAVREEKRQWLNDCLEKLHDLNTTVEAEKEKVASGRKNSKSNKSALDGFDNRLQKHKFHIAKLELILKLLDNEELDPSALDSIKDSLEYYLETAPDDDGAIDVEHEFDIYEDLDLDSYGYGDVTAKILEKDAVPPVAGAPVKKEDDHHEVVVEAKKEVVAPAAAAPVVAGKAASGKSADKPAITEISSKPHDLTNLLQGTGAASKKAEDKTAAPAHIAEDVVSRVTDSGKSKGPPAKAPEAVPVVAAAQPVKPPALTPQQPPALTKATPAASSGPPPALAAPTAAPTAVAPSEVVKATAAVQQSAPPALAPAAAAQPAAPTAVPTPSVTAPVSASSSVQSVESSVSSSTSSNAAPINSNVQSPLTGEMLATYNLLKASAYFQPDADSDKSSGYSPKNFYPGCHSSFPTTPVYTSNAECTALFDKVSFDSLFFSFYYQPNTLQQVLAGKRLKKNSWRFHKKYTTWFQRHAEPKIATQDYEEGTYVYFDYESGKLLVLLIFS